MPRSKIWPPSITRIEPGGLSPEGAAPGVTDQPSAARRLEVEGPGWRILLAGLRRPHRFVERFLARIIADRIFTYAAAMS